jgi:formylglycine-generating enzyme
MGVPRGLKRSSRFVAAAIAACAFCACNFAIGIEDLKKVDCVGKCLDTSANHADSGSDQSASQRGKDGSSAGRIVLNGSELDASTPKPGATGGGGATRSDAGSRCTGNAGPQSIRVGTFCIDQTEVTNRDYVAFLLDKQEDTSDQPTACAFNTTYVPATSWPAPYDKSDHPVVSVDWCDAHSYCKWAGKRLCGGFDGRNVPLASIADATKDEWHYVCTGGGRTAFPYGNLFLPKACNDYEFGVNMPLPVASIRTCMGGFSGVSDIAGNVWEWENACDGGTGENDTCALRGGSFAHSGATFTKCASAFQANFRVRKQTYVDLGIRCCSDTY